MEIRTISFPSHHETRVRRLARQYGYCIHKSRGGYQLVDNDTNTVVIGDDATLAH